MRDARREAADGHTARGDTSSEVLSSILLDSHTSPSGTVAREEVRARLQDALETMDEMDREVLVLRHFEQLSPVETSQVLGIQEKAAGMRYVRALKRLREILGALPGGLSGFRL